ncbi:MAG: Trm112 family protein [Ferruginibacter sp.]
MTLKTIQKLCCPFDKLDLSLAVFTKDTNDDILTGILSCAGCKRQYPIVHGVPIMTPDEYRQFHLEKPLLAEISRV